MNQLSLTEFETSIFEIDPAKQLVNLTKIAKAFNKRISDWMRLEATKEFLEALAEYSDMHKCISVVKGGVTDGDAQGTWGNQEVAIEFAQWISPKFKVFCIKHLKRLFNDGSTSVSGSYGKTNGMESLMAEELMIQSLQRIVQVKRQMAVLQAQLDAEMVGLKKIQPHGKASCHSVGNPVLKGLEPKKGSMTGAERARNYRKRLRNAKDQAQGPTLIPTE